MTFKNRRSEEEKHDGNSDISGILQKYSPAFFRSWQRRKVELCNHSLKYFKEKNKDWSQLAGVLNFDLYHCFVDNSRQKYLVFEIKIIGLDRKFEFRCENADLYQAWVGALEF